MQYGFGTVTEELPRGYTVVKKLGQGAGGTVYVAKQNSLGRTVALKRIPVSIDLDPSAQAELLIEGRALAALRSPSVIAIYDIRFTHDAAWLVTQYVEGQDLQAIIDSHPEIPTEIAMRWICQICRALSDAAAVGVIHRDVKPANILIDTGGNALLADFGVADIRRSLAENATGSALGTPAYMAPEQIRGESTDERSDLYAVALIAYQLLTGEHPFLPTATNLESLFEAQLHQPALSAAPPTLNRATQKCLAQALEKDPTQRQSGAQVFADQLQRAVKKPSRTRGRRRGVLTVLAVCAVGIALGLTVGLLLSK